MCRIAVCNLVTKSVIQNMTQIPVCSCIVKSIIQSAYKYSDDSLIRDPIVRKSR